MLEPRKEMQPQGKIPSLGKNMDGIVHSWDFSVNLRLWKSPSNHSKTDAAQMRVQHGRTTTGTVVAWHVERSSRGAPRSLTCAGASGRRFIAVVRCPDRLRAERETCGSAVGGVPDPARRAKHRPPADLRGKSAA